MPPSVQVSGRGVVVSADLRRRVERSLAKVARLLPKATEARAVLAREGHRYLAEVTLQAKGATLHAEAEDPVVRAALDAALAGLERQAFRRKDRLRSRKPRAAVRAARPGEPADAAEATAGGTGDLPGALVRRRLAAKPMSLEEACEQFRLGGRDLLVFTNAASRAVNVLRRRPDGRVELVEPAR